jgi:hypothetical protein
MEKIINIHYSQGGRKSAPEIGRHDQQYFSYFVVVSFASVEETRVLYGRINDWFSYISFILD